MLENEISKKKKNSREAILKSFQKILIEALKHNSLEDLQT